MNDDTLDLELTQAARRRQRQQLRLGLGLAATVAATAGAFLLVEAIAGRTAITSVSTPSASISRDPCADSQRAGCSREDFLDALRRFDGTVRPALAATSLSAWDPERLQTIDALEADALAAFDAGEYGDANRAIDEALTAAEEALDHAQSEFARSVDQAQRAFGEDDSELAQQAIDRALLIAPENTEAQALAERIAVMPTVLTALEAARVAAIENRPTEEIRQLRAALTLDPQRSSLRERIATLTSADQTTRYAAAVSSAESALARGQLTQTQQAIDHAKGIDPTQDLSFLQRRLDDAITARRLGDALAGAEAAVHREDWRGALASYEQALALDAAHAQAVGGAAEARAVVAGLDALEIYLRDPLRIGTSRANQAARRLQAELAPKRGLSTTLDGQLDQLERYLELATQPVRVTVVSDGFTDISVRRVGQVGTRERATIQLTPGRYELEGRRPGYRSKLVALDVSFGIERMQVEVVCDEPTA